MPFTIVFDLDDTLIPTGHLYREAIWQCGRIITQALGPRSPSVRKLMEHQERLDSELAVFYGYRNGRFPNGLIGTYRHFCRRAGCYPDSAVERAVLHAALRFTEGPFHAFPGVPEVLTQFHRRQHRLHVVTRGDGELQRRKLCEAQIGHYFSSLVVVPMGTKRNALRHLMETEPGPWIMVGDGRRSDIRPALEIGMRAVWLRGGDPWEHLDEELDPSRHHTIDDLRELPALLERLGREHF